MTQLLLPLEYNPNGKRLKEVFLNEVRWGADFLWEQSILFDHNSATCLIELSKDLHVVASTSGCEQEIVTAIYNAINNGFHYLLIKVERLML